MSHIISCHMSCLNLETRGLVHAILCPHLSPTMLWLLAKCAQTQAGLFGFNSALCFLVYDVTDNHFFRFWLTISSDGRLSTSRESWFEGCSSKQWHALSLSLFFFFNWQWFSSPIFWDIVDIEHYLHLRYRPLIWLAYIMKQLPQ